MLTGDLLFSVSCTCYAMSNSWGWNLAAAALCGMGYGLGGMIPASLVLKRCFAVHQGLALGIAAAGSGVAAVAAPPLLTWIIAGTGLEFAFMLEGILGVIAALSVFLLIRVPYEVNGVTVERLSSGQKSEPVMLPVMGGVFLIGVSAGPGFSHLSVLYDNAGMEPMKVSILIAYLGGVLLLGKVLYGWMCDKLGSYYAGLLAYGSLTLGLFLCCLAHLQQTWCMYMSSTLLGLGLPLASVALPVFADDFSTEEGFPFHLRRINILYMLGSLCFGPVPGILADATGSYVISYLMFGMLTLLSASLMYWAYSKK